MRAAGCAAPLPTQLPNVNVWMRDQCQSLHPEAYARRRGEVEADILQIRLQRHSLAATQPPAPPAPPALPALLHGVAAQRLAHVVQARRGTALFRRCATSAVCVACLLLINLVFLPIGVRRSGIMADRWQGQGGGVREWDSAAVRRWAEGLGLGQDVLESLEQRGVSGAALAAMAPQDIAQYVAVPGKSADVAATEALKLAQGLRLALQRAAEPSDLWELRAKYHARVTLTVMGGLFGGWPSFFFAWGSGMGWWLWKCDFADDLVVGGVHELAMAAHALHCALALSVARTGPARSASPPLPLLRSGYPVRRAAPHLTVLYYAVLGEDTDLVLDTFPRWYLALVSLCVPQVRSTWHAAHAVAISSL
jgi:hypothetical protein